MDNKPDIVVGTWGMSAFDTAPGDSKELISSLHRAGARVFDSALVYGRGSIDEQLGNVPGIEIISKIPALNRELLQSPSADFADHYPTDHVRACIEKLLHYHHGTIETLLLHNWHASWHFDQAREILAEYIPKNIHTIGVSAQQDEISSAQDIPIVEVPIDPVIHRLYEDRIGASRVLVRSPFCHGLLLKDTQDNMRQSRFTPQQLGRLTEFREQHIDLSARVQAAFGYIYRLPIHIQGIIVGITREEQWIDISRQLQKMTQNQ